MVARFRAIRVATTASFPNTSAISKRLLLIKGVVLLMSRVCVYQARVCTISLVLTELITVVIRGSLFVRWPFGWAILYLLRSWAVPWLIFWSSLRRLVLVVIDIIDINVLNINFYWNYLHRFIALYVRGPSSPSSSLGLNLVRLILVSSTFILGTAQIVDNQIVDWLVIEVLRLGVSILFRVSLSPLRHLFPVLCWVGRRWVVVMILEVLMGLLVVIFCLILIHLLIWISLEVLLIRWLSLESIWVSNTHLLVLRGLVVLVLGKVLLIHRVLVLLLQVLTLILALALKVLWIKSFIKVRFFSWLVQELILSPLVIKLILLSSNIVSFGRLVFQALWLLSI